VSSFATALTLTHLSKIICDVIHGFDRRLCCWLIYGRVVTALVSVGREHSSSWAVCYIRSWITEVSEFTVHAVKHLLDDCVFAVSWNCQFVFCPVFSSVNQRDRHCIAWLCWYVVKSLLTHAVVMTLWWPCGVLADSVRVKDIVQHVREQRPGMVQTDAQYKFLYDIIPHIVQAQNTVRCLVTPHLITVLLSSTCSRYLNAVEQCDGGWWSSMYTWSWLKLFYPDSRVNARANFFSVRIISLWNRLPAGLVQVDNLIKFKSALRSVNLSFALLGKW